MLHRGTRSTARSRTSVCCGASRLVRTVASLPAFLQLAPVLERRLADSVDAGYTGELKLSFFRSGLKNTARAAGGSAPWLDHPATTRYGGLLPPHTFSWSSGIARPRTCVRCFGRAGRTLPRSSTCCSAAGVQALPLPDRGTVQCGLRGTGAGGLHYSRSLYPNQAVSVALDLPV
jgi:hypothetical protein